MVMMVVMMLGVDDRLVGYSPSVQTDSLLCCWWWWWGWWLSDQWWTKSESTGWHCLLVTHWLVWLSKKHKRGKVAKSAFKSSFQWVVRLLTMIITGETGRTRFKIRREEKRQIKVQCYLHRKEIKLLPAVGSCHVHAVMLLLGSWVKVLVVGRVVAAAAIAVVATETDAGLVAFAVAI